MYSLLAIIIAGQRFVWSMLSVFMPFLVGLCIVCAWFSWLDAGMCGSCRVFYDLVCRVFVLY